MRVRKYCVSALFGFTLAIAAAAHAGGGAGERVSDIVAQQQRIRADVVAEKNGWDNIPVARRQELLEKQDQLMSMIGGKSSLDELPSTDRADAVSTLQWIEALAQQADDERQICRRERATGSNRVTRICRKAGDIRRLSEQTRDALRAGETRRPPPPERPGQQM